ncbi:hypothetical protein PO124_28845 [Bacillus licheniformis]|nr:hypothetical protein [Bacillus licheniformis]
METIQNVRRFRPDFFRNQRDFLCACSLRLLNNLRPPYDQAVAVYDLTDNILFPAALSCCRLSLCCSCSHFLL